MGKLEARTLRLDPDTDIPFIEDTIRRFFPSVKNFSECARLIFAYARAAIIEGSLPWNEETVKALLRVLRTQDSAEESGNGEGRAMPPVEDLRGQTRYSALRRAVATGCVAFRTSSVVALAGRLA